MHTMWSTLYTQHSDNTF